MRDSLGDPLEREYYDKGYRDWGASDPQGKEVVFNPNEKPSEIPERRVFYAKRPAYLEPPWFSKPLIKAKNNLIVPAGATVAIFDRRIPARNRAVVTMVGIDVSPVAPLYAGQLEFWFEQSGEVIPIFDDQTPTSYGSSDPVRSGRTTVLPGTADRPFCLHGCGLSFQVKGEKILTFNVENKGGVPVTIRGLLGFYIYWLPYGATEFEDAEIQQ